jgi:hypothetical protein
MHAIQLFNLQSSTKTLLLFGSLELAVAKSAYQIIKPNIATIKDKSFNPVTGHLKRILSVKIVMVTLCTIYFIGASQKAQILFFFSLS